MRSHELTKGIAVFIINIYIIYGVSADASGCEAWWVMWWERYFNLKPSVVSASTMVCSHNYMIYIICLWQTGGCSIQKLLLEKMSVWFWSWTQSFNEWHTVNVILYSSNMSKLLWLALRLLRCLFGLNCQREQWRSHGGAHAPHRKSVPPHIKFWKTLNCTDTVQ